ncbi:MAG: hypothetical protein V4805_08775 [Pseudomonadota bacterium]
MHTPTLDGASTASKSDLMRGIGIAAVLASIILMVAVLPAEYGIDPTGIGQALGLKNLSGSPAPAVNTGKIMPVADAAPASTGTIASKQTVPYRTDTREVVLQAGQGLEVKTLLAKGATLIYSWKTSDGAKIDHDFHGEPVNAQNNEFESYIEDKGISQSQGSVIAPFTGTHGWYWYNPSKSAVTVMLQASGFYTEMINK